MRYLSGDDIAFVAEDSLDESWHILCAHAQDMQIRDIMSRYVEVISRDADVRAAAIKMRDLNVNVIPVCDGATFVGILTERDIAVRLAAEGYDATRTCVGEIMTRDLTYCLKIKRSMKLRS